MREDWLVEAMEMVADTGRQACDAIAETIAALDRGRLARLEGRSVTEVVEVLISGGGRDVRRQSSDAFRNWERTIAHMRSAVIRALVDEDGLSLTEAAHMLLISPSGRPPLSAGTRRLGGRK